MTTIGQCAGALLLMTSLMAGTAPAEQSPQTPRATGPLPQAQTPRINDQNASATRDELNSLLRDYPPSLREVLSLDPTLLSNPDYLALYPALNNFLNQHAEVGHNPSYFLGRVSIADDNPGNEIARMWIDAMSDLGAFLAASMLIGLFAWLVKTLVDYRRWNRITKVQSEVHTKLLDRFSTNEDLLAYIQTPAGRRFLESAPLPLDGGSNTISAPIGRILWSVQAGLVMVCAGLGLYFAVPQAPMNGVTQPLSVISVLAISLGIGLMISGGVSYMISQRLGLFVQNKQAPSQT